MDAPVSLSELMVMKNLACILKRNNDPREAEMLVESWLEKTGETQSFHAWMSKARESENFTSPSGTQARLMSFFSNHFDDLDFEKDLGRKFNLAAALSRSIAETDILPNSILASKYSNIHVDYSADGLMSLVYMGKDDQKYSDAVQVTVSMEQMGMAVLDYTLESHSFNELCHLSEDPNSPYNDDVFVRLLDALAIKNGSDWIKENPPLLVMHNTSTMHQAIVTLGEDAGDFVISRYTNDQTLSYSETFATFRPLLHTPYEPFPGLRYRLGLNIPNVADKAPPSLFFIHRPLFLKSFEMEEFNLLSSEYPTITGLFDETGERVVSPSFYYGISLACADTVMGLNREALTKFDNHMYRGLNTEGAQKKTVEFLLAALNSRCCCDGVSQTIDENVQVTSHNPTLESSASA